MNNEKVFRYSNGEVSSITDSPVATNLFLDYFSNDSLDSGLLGQMVEWLDLFTSSILHKTNKWRVRWDDKQEIQTSLLNAINLKAEYFNPNTCIVTTFSTEPQMDQYYDFDDACELNLV